MKETELYPPIKALLEAQGYVVKSEVGAIDVMGLHPDAPEDPVIVELKTGFSLSLVHQAIARQAVTDAVYLAVPRGSGRRWLGALKQMKTLCRRLGLGLITVRIKDGHTELHLDPGPYKPRRSKPRRIRLLREFARLDGDPNTGGATRRNLVTAYRQDALRLAEFLASDGPAKGALVARQTGVTQATRMMRDNHYGWFEKIETGIYTLSPAGHEALAAR